jgi:hypothetical protein
MNVVNAMSASEADNPELRFAAKPRNTMLPVMLATNTCPSPRYDTASTRPVPAVCTSRATTGR